LQNAENISKYLVTKSRIETAAQVDRLFFYSFSASLIISLEMASEMINSMKKEAK
jgi:hypothetical protein